MIPFPHYNFSEEGFLPGITGTSSTFNHQRQPGQFPTNPSRTVNMSDNGDVEVAFSTVLPKEVLAEQGSIKLFNKWSYDDVEIRDISLT
jgi:hypothetical protein